MRARLKSIFTILFVLFFTVGANANANRCEDLTGKTFIGADGQGGEPAEGCEGCGNDGAIEMTSATDATVVWVGSDVMENCTYAVRYPRVTFTCQFSGTEKMTISKNCSTLNTNRGLRFSVAAPQP